MLIIETLNSNGKAIDTGLAKAGKAPGFYGSRVCLQRDFSGRFDRDTRTYARYQLRDSISAEQARGTATDKNAFQLTSPYPWQVLLQITQQGVYILSLWHLASKWV